MKNLTEKLLERALDSILHGSTQILTRVNSNGQEEHQEVRINDLRISLVEKIAQYLANTPKFQEIMAKAFNDDLVKKLQENALSKIEFSNLPYDVQRTVQDRMKNLEVEVKKYKLVAESVVKD